MNECIISYLHHGKETNVYAHLKGKHREHCLCYDCEHFSPDDEENNCSIAQALFEFDKQHEVTTPVWECTSFKKTIPF